MRGRPHQRIVERYERFAAFEAPGRSPVYAEVAAAIATDERILGFLAEMPPVLVYVADPAERAAFAQSVAEVGATWIANEGPEVIPGLTDELMPDRPAADVFALCVDGVPVAWTDGHGTSIDWRGGLG